MDFNELELQFLRYEHLLDEYRIELSTGDVYIARRADRAAIAPQFDLYLPSGARYGRQVLPSALTDVELYFLGFFTWLNSITYQR